MSAIIYNDNITKLNYTNFKITKVTFVVSQTVVDFTNSNN